MGGDTGPDVAVLGALSAARARDDLEVVLVGPEELLRERLESDKSVFEVVAVGPVPMMAAVADTTKPFGVKTTVSLNPIMVDGIGMCGACRVNVGGETKFACVDGPEFDGHQVDFAELRRRLGAFKEQETVSLEQWRCSCHGK